MQIFHASANSLAKVTIVAAVAGLCGLVWAAYRRNAGSFTTAVNVAKAQPVPFSHKHHVGDDGIDCRYCHSSVETSAFAGVPPLSTCMTCHSQLFTDQPRLAPLIRAYTSGVPLHWQRVHQLPQFAYFNHSIHIAKGV